MRSTSSYNETELLHLIAQGDEKAFRHLFNQYNTRFYAVAFKMTKSEELAEEMVQDIFLKIWQNRAALTDIVNPETYFFTALYRQIYRHYKKTALESKMLKLIAASPHFQNITDETILANESQRLLQQAVAQLPKQQQLVFRLSKVEGLSREQIATKLHLSPNTVRNHLFEAIQFIRTYLNHPALIIVALLIDGTV